MKNKFQVEIIIFVILILFCVYRSFYHIESRILKMFSPTVFAVDLNGNRSIDSGEIVCISGIQTFEGSLSKNDKILAKHLNISEKDALSLAYLTKDFAQNFLFHSVVEFVPDVAQANVDCVSGDILVDKRSYRENILKQGLAYSEENFDKKQFNLRLAEAKKLQPVILNRKSKKYHEFGCKYGKVAQDSVLLIKEELPQNAIPCKWCHKGTGLGELVENEDFPDRISSDFIKMYLTDMTNNLRVSSDCSTSVCQMFLKEINEAQSSIDIATYGWVSIKEIDDAIKSAVARGVKFRFVYDYSGKSNYYPDSSRIASLASVAKNDLVAGNFKVSEYLMHNKFAIFDSQKVMTGSLNYSKTDFSEFNSNVVFLVNSSQLAKIYTDEFEQMLSGKFHTEKKKRDKVERIYIPETMLEAYFSPQDNAITSQVIGYIDGAQKYIYMPVFVLTHKGMESALIRAKQRGVDVKIIVDSTNVFVKGSSVKTLRETGIPVKVENYAGKLHSKSIIIDDKYILAGSMNFSNSGERRNDENMLIVKNSRLTMFYREFFEYLWKKIPDKYLSQIPRAEGNESLGSCFDGIDNDFDGRIDKADEGCIVK